MSGFYNRGKASLLNGGIDLSGDSIRVLLVDSGYTFSVDHNFVDDVSPGDNEVTGTGYARKTLSGKAITENDTDDRAEFSADNLLWSSIDVGEVDALVMYKFVTSDADSPLLLYIDSGGLPVTTNGGDLTVNWSADGIFYF